MQFTAILALVLTAVFVGTCDAQRFQQQGFRGSGRGRGGLGGGLGEIFRRGGDLLQGGGRLIQGAGQVARAFTQQPCCLQAFPQKCLPRVVYGAQGCQQNLIQQAWTFNDGRCSQRGIVRSVFKGIFDGMNLYNSRDSCSNNCINPNIGFNNGRRGQRFDNGGYGQRFDNYDNLVGGHYEQDRYIGGQRRGGAQFGGQRGGAQYRGVQDRRFRD